MEHRDTALVEALTLWQRPWGLRRVFAALLVVAAIAAGTAFVYATGGIKFVFSHSMYLAILAAGALFGPWGGVAAGAAAGLALGPFMPIDTLTGEMQQPLNWLYRTGFFVVVGATTGALVDAVTQLAGRDPVTGAPGQVPLRHDLRRAIDRQKSGDLSGFSLLTVKLKNHAEVAGTFGPVSGRTFLAAFVARLEVAAGTTSRVYHLHGDTFAMIVPNPELAPLRSRLREQAHLPVLARGVPVFPSVSLGRADCPDHSQFADVLVQQATSAVETGAQQPGAEHGYDVHVDHLNRQNLLLLSGLRAAMEHDELEMHYQPKIALADAHVSGFEALVRWSHPQHGLLPPLRFVPQAEKTDLIQDLTAWVLRAALRDVDRLRSPQGPWHMAINLSARNLHEPSLVSVIEQSLADGAVEPDHLEVEVTESAVLSDPDQARAVLGRIRQLGVAVAIDDFGAGNTSLRHLKDLPASTLKIDRAFVQNLARDAADRHIVASIAVMAHHLGMDVIAEGVEDADTLEIVGDLGCDAAQGYLISHPRPAGAFEGFRYRGGAISRPRPTT